jgi:hypothetical protein
MCGVRQCKEEKGVVKRGDNGYIKPRRIKEEGVCRR